MRLFYFTWHKKIIYYNIFNLLVFVLLMEVYKKRPEIERTAIKWVNNELVDNFDLWKIIRDFIEESKLSLQKVKTQEDFEKWLFSVWMYFKQLPITKIYNTTSLWKIKEFTDYTSDKQFVELFHLYNNSLCNSWWNCYHFVIFLFSLLSALDIENKLTKKIISFNPDYDHVVFLVWFQWKEFIIDLFAKWTSFVQENKAWNKVFLSVETDEKLNDKNVLWTIINPLDFSLWYWRKLIKPSIYTNLSEFVDNLPISNFVILNLKTRLWDSRYHLVLFYDDLKNKIYLINRFNEKEDFIVLSGIDIMPKFENVSEFKKFIFSYIPRTKELDNLLNIVDIDFLNETINRFKQVQKRKDNYFTEEFFPY